MRISDLNYLLEVARAKSISGAANKLYLAQTTLSSIVNSIENQLGVQVFVRTSKGVILTPKGEELVAIAEEIVGKFGNMESLSSQRQGVSQSVEIFAYPSACSFITGHLALKINQMFKNVAFQLKETASTQIVSRVASGGGAVALGSSAQHEYFSSQYQAHQNDLVFEDLYTDNFCCCVSAKSKFANYQNIDMALLKNEYLAITKHYKESAKSSVGQLHKRFEQFAVFPNVDIIKNSIVEHNFISVLPRLVVETDALYKNGHIKAIAINDMETRLYNFLVYRTENKITELEKYIISTIKQFYQNLKTTPQPLV